MSGCVCAPCLLRAIMKRDIFDNPFEDRMKRRCFLSDDPWPPESGGADPQRPGLAENIGAVDGGILGTFVGCGVLASFKYAAASLTAAVGLGATAPLVLSALVVTGAALAFYGFGKSHWAFNATRPPLSLATRMSGGAALLPLSYKMIQNFPPILLGKLMPVALLLMCSLAGMEFGRHTARDMATLKFVP